MTDFLRLKIEIYVYSRISERAAFFASVGEGIEEAVTDQRGDGGWFGETLDFFDDVRSIWNTLEERESEGAVKLNQDSPEHYLAKVEPEHIESMRLVELLTLLRKATAAKPEVEEYNWNTPGNFERKQDHERDQRFITAFRNGLIVPALQRLNELMELSPADIEEVLDLKPIFDSLTVEQFRTWNGPRDFRTEPMEGRGGQALHVPHPDYHPVVTQWTEAVYCTPFYIDPYREVPGEEGGLPPPRFMGLGERSQPTPEEFFAVADLDEVRKYMSLCLRGEKWRDGFIAGEFQRGVIRVAFERLEQLAEPVLDLGALCSVLYGKAKPAAEGKVPVVGSSGIYSYCDHPLVNHPTIAVGRKGTAGKATFMCEPCWVSDTAFYLDHFSDRIDLKYLFFVLQWKPLTGIQAKTTMPSLQRHELEGMAVPCRRQQKQRAIVQNLEAILAARVARLKEIELELERKAALMAHLFAYGTQNEPRRTTALGLLPETWEVRSLDGLATVQTGLAKNKKLESSDSIELPYLRVANVQAGYLDLSEIKLVRVAKSVVNRFLLQEGDVLLTEGGDFDKLGRGFIWQGQISPCLHQNHVFAVRTKRNALSPEFLTYYCQAPAGKAYFLSVAHKTTNLACINTTKLRALPVPIPALGEQEEIASVLAKFDVKIKSLESEANLLDELLRATLEELMSGRLSVAPLLREVIA